MKHLYPAILLLLCVQLSFAGTNYTLNINYENTSRNFIVHLPTGHTAGQQYPLVFNLHGYTSNAAQQQLYSGMDAIADANNFIVVYPNGLNSSWNSGFVVYNSAPDDVGFISKIIDTVNLLYGVNLNRVYSCGMSNGGFQSYRLACDLESRIAAIASVTGSMTNTMINNCSVSRNVPVLQIHGTMDPTVPYGGSGGVLAIEDVVAFWVGKNKCATTQDTTDVPDTNTGDLSTVQQIRWRTCLAGSQVWFYKVANGGHTWPGSAITFIGTTNQDINASQEIWDFFNRYTLNGPVGVEEVEKGERVKVKVFPNPANDLLRIEADENIERVEVFNAMGERVLVTDNVTGNTQISIAALPDGIYVLKAEGVGFVSTVRIVKQ